MTVSAAPEGPRDYGDHAGGGGVQDGGPDPGSSSVRTFEQIMAELEELTGRLASGDLGIEAAADLYERAERLHAEAGERLAQVRARVEGLGGPRGPQN